MQSKPAKFLLLITVILGLSLSAIAACACTHHRPKAAPEPLSCHGPNHEPQPESIEAVPTGDLAGSDCKCILPVVTPAIVVKNKFKRLDSGAVDLAENASSPSFERKAIAERGDSSILYTDPRILKQTFSRGGPSRAPPRL